MKRKLIALLSAAAMMVTFAACAPAADESDTLSPDSDCVFTDDCGREVEIPDRITGIVPSGPLAQIVLLAIAPDLFVGLADPLGDSARGILPDELFSLPCFGQLYGSASLNVEQLAAAAPELIIDIGTPKDRAAEELDELETQTTIPAVFIAASLEGMPETFRTLGRLLGREERAEQLAQFCERVYSRTVSIMEAVGEDNKVSALYITGDEGLNVLAKTSYHAELIDMLVNNLAVVETPSSRGLGNEVTMEQLMLWDPDFVIFSPGSIYSAVGELATWDSMTAIARGNYVETPESPHNWMGSPPSVQRYLGMIWLTAVLYPDYCEYDVKAEILEYYELFYGCALTDAQYETLTANAFLK